MRFKGLLANQSIWTKGVAIVTLSFIGLCIGTVLALCATKLLSLAVSLDDIDKMLIEQAIMSAVAFILIGWICIKLTIKSENTIFSAKGIPHLKIILLSILIIVFSTPLINQLALWNSQMTLPGVLEPLENVMREMEDAANDVTTDFLGRTSVCDLIVNLIVVALIPAIGEEFLFRGTIQQVMVESGWNKHLCVFLASVIFSAIHLQFYGFIPRVVLGMILGYAFLWSGSIWVSSLIHFINNSTVVLSAFVVGRMGLAETTEKGMEKIDSLGTESYIFTAISLVLVVLTMIQIRNCFSENKSSL